MAGLSLRRAGSAFPGQSGCFCSRFGEGRRLNPAGVIWALSPPGIEIQAPKTAQTRLLLFCACTTPVPLLLRSCDHPTQGTSVLILYYNTANQYVCQGALQFAMLALQYPMPAILSWLHAQHESLKGSQAIQHQCQYCRLGSPG